MESYRPTSQDLGANEFWWKTCSVLLATVAIATLVLFCWTKRRLWELAARIPGPTPLPLLGNVLTFVGCDLVQLFKIIVQFVEEYGSIFKFWIGQDLFILLTNPVYVEKVLGNKNSISRAGYVTELAKPYFRNGLLLSEGDTWRIHRKIIQSTFHNNVLDQFVENFAKNSSILVDKMVENSSGSPFDVYPLINLCTLDVICETAMGTAVNAQLDDDGQYVQTVLKSLELLSERFKRPWLSVDWIFSLTQLGKEQAETLRYLHGKAQKVISEKLAKFQASGRQKTRLDDLESVKRRKLSLLDLLIEDEQLTPEEIHDEVVTIMGAGSETTANTCCYALFLLGVHQDIQQRVLEEQQSLFGEDMHRPATCEDLPNMPYLEQVIKESLRLFPPIPYVFRKIKQETDLGNGYVLPAGCSTMLVTYMIHRNPEYFPDPERFDPDRFSPENSVGRHPYAYIPFGAGRRMCVAYKFGIMEAKTILSTILRRFRVVESVGGIRTLADNLESGLVLKPANGFNIRMEARSADKKLAGATNI